MAHNRVIGALIYGGRKVFCNGERLYWDCVMITGKEERRILGFAYIPDHVVGLMSRIPGAFSTEIIEEFLARVNPPQTGI